MFQLLISILLFTSYAHAVESDSKLILSESNMVVLDSAFTFASVAKLQQEIVNKANAGQKELILVLNTPGGSVPAGNSLIDTVKGLGVKVHTLTIFAASMGYHTVQSLGTRYILPSGTLMSHRAFIKGLGGEVPGKALTRINYILDSVLRLDEIASKRVNMPLVKYQRLIADEFWVEGHKSVKLGHADKVVYAKCDKSLSGTYIKKILVWGQAIEVELSKCPLITGPLSIATNNLKIKNLIKRFFDLKNFRRYEVKF